MDHWERHLVRIVVYTKPHGPNGEITCQQCEMTKRKLEARGLEFVEKDIYEHIGFVKDILGLTSAPVVVVALEPVREDTEIVVHDSWAGFRPDKIDEIALA